MKYRILKTTYGDQTNKFYVQQKSFLFWDRIDDRVFSTWVPKWAPHTKYAYELFDSYEKAETALNDYIKKTENNTLVKTEVAH